MIVPYIYTSWQAFSRDEKYKLKMTINNLDKISNQIRKNIFEILEFLGSKESQLEYQKNVPIAQVSNELFNQWYDNYYPKCEIHNMAFNETEREILENFNEIFNIISKKTPKDLPFIDEFVTTNEWFELNQLAKKTLDNLITI